MRSSIVPEAKYGSPWSRDELVLALYLYCQIPFAQTKANNPEVVKLASMLGRTPAAVARKLGNFGAFDEVLAERGVTGLTHVSKADSEVWAEFSSDWSCLVGRAQRLLAQADSKEPLEEADDSVIVRPPVETEGARVVSVRLCQAFFRRAVLASYGVKCCVCGLDLRELLIASHIVPWAASEATRADPCNGLCLCALHDRAFDRGIMTVDPSDLTIRVGARAIASRNAAVRSSLAELHHRRILLPNRFAPAPECLAWHADNVYLG